MAKLENLVATVNKVLKLELMSPSLNACKADLISNPFIANEMDSANASNREKGTRKTLVFSNGTGNFTFHPQSPRGELLPLSDSEEQ